jgi:hypothetical protein
MYTHTIIHRGGDPPKNSRKVSFIKVLMVFIKTEDVVIQSVLAHVDNLSPIQCDTS